jgi:hypothetical protein
VSHDTIALCVILRLADIAVEDDMDIPSELPQGMINLLLDSAVDADSGTIETFSNTTLGRLFSDIDKR